jgi:hypothetical protein
MEKRTVESICQSIYKKYPAVKGQNPKVTKQGDDRYLLLFSITGKTPDGKTIQQQVRVVATEAGQILKSSMSR